jgi:hypothetical protein
VRNALAALIVLIGTISANAEQVATRDSTLLRPVFPTQQKLIIRSEALFPPTLHTRLGTFTLVPPKTNGEVITVAIPVGELMSRAARAVSDAHRLRVERKIDGRIVRELQQLDVRNAVSGKPQK